MKVLLGMSGGFDSTFAALKLKEMGYDVEGATLVMHAYTDTAQAESAAVRLGIPLHIIDCRTRFSEIVENNFIEEYKNGRTPNPCIICNREVKFKVLLDYALSHGFDMIATGHYARVSRVGERYTLLPPRDKDKDQSYMLSRLTQDELSHLLLPLSDEVKRDLRERVKREDLPIADSKDSQEICFIPEGKYYDYLEKYLGEAKEGDFIDNDGNVLGRHRGIVNYTVGQRKGLGIALGHRVFVSKIDVENNTVTLSGEGDCKHTVDLRDVVYMGINEPDDSVTLDVNVKIRYRARPVSAAATLHKDGSLTLEFSEPVRSASPGQTAVLYVNDAVIASGFIQ